MNARPASTCQYDLSRNHTTLFSKNITIISRGVRASYFLALLINHLMLGPILF